MPRVIIYDILRNFPEKEIQACIRKQIQDRLKEEDVASSVSGRVASTMKKRTG
jgi:hypothetical protein